MTRLDPSEVKIMAIAPSRMKATAEALFLHDAQWGRWMNSLFDEKFYDVGKLITDFYRIVEADGDPGSLRYRGSVANACLAMEGLIDQLLLAQKWVSRPLREDLEVSNSWLRFAGRGFDPNTHDLVTEVRRWFSQWNDGDADPARLLEVNVAVLRAMKTRLDRRDSEPMRSYVPRAFGWTEAMAYKTAIKHSIEHALEVVEDSDLAELRFQRVKEGCDTAVEALVTTSDPATNLHSARLAALHTAIQPLRFSLEALVGTDAVTTSRTLAYEQMWSQTLDTLFRRLSSPDSDEKHKAWADFNRQCDDVKSFDALLVALAVVSHLNARLNERPGQIVRQVRFRREHQQVGVSVLSYFAVVLQQRLPDAPVEVGISQAGTRVTMTIKYDDDREEEVSRVLSEYGQVLQGALLPEQLLAQPIHVLALKNKLQVVETELRLVRELQQIERHYADRSYADARDESAFLRERLGVLLEHSRSLGSELVQLVDRMESGRGTVEAIMLIERLADALIARDENASRALLVQASEASPGLFTRVSEFLLSSACSGVVGNSTYEWIKALVASFPR